MENNEVIIEENDIIEENVEQNMPESEINLADIISPQNYDWINDETLVVIIRVDKSELSQNLSRLPICGKPMIEWVSIATAGPVQKIIREPADGNFLEDVKGYCRGKKYLAVFYSDTPLLQRNTFCEIMDYFSKNRYNVIELPRGYVFRVDYLLTIDEIFSPMKKSFSPRNFDQINCAKSLAYANKVLQEQILNYHKENGVILIGENTIFIDADVEIESGVIIYPNNVIKGQTIIGKNVVLESGNVIKDSIIGDNCEVAGSYIVKSKVKDGEKIKPFTNLNEEVVGD